ncbi:hypothetical protein ACWY4P_37610 [Streptomyces sp. LZ34]
MDIAWELGGLLGAREDGAFGLVGSEADGSVAEQVRKLAGEAERAWEQYLVPGAIGPSSPTEVAERLAEIDGERAAELMTYLAVENVVFPGQPRPDGAHTRGKVERVRQLLGDGASWYTNVKDISPGSREWMPVTRYTYDGVVAGTGNGLVVVLLQVGEG